MKSLVFKLLNPLFRLLKIANLPFVGEYHGLGNRIKGMANYYSRGYRRYFLQWRSDSWVTAPFEDLFVLKGCAIYRAYWMRKVLTRFLPMIGLDEIHPFWSFLLPKDFNDGRFAHEWSFAKGKMMYSIDWRYNDIPQEMKDFFLPFFQKLMPSKKVQKRIDFFCQSISKMGGYVAVHIRNSDLKEDAKDVCAVSSIMNVMQRYPKETKFFVSAMTAEVSQEVHEAFPGRIYELPDKDYKSMIDAVADMWLLGRGEELVCSPGSTFSEVAWWWGGAAVPVTMLKSEYNQKDM